MVAPMPALTATGVSCSAFTRLSAPPLRFLGECDRLRTHHHAGQPSSCERQFGLPPGVPEPGAVLPDLTVAASAGAGYGGHEAHFDPSRRATRHRSARAAAGATT